MDAIMPTRHENLRPRTAVANPLETARPANPGEGLLSEEDWSCVGERFGLTARELSVATLIFEGKTRHQIARRIGRAPGTIRVCIDRLFAKVQVHDRLGMALRVMRVYLESKRG